MVSDEKPVVADADKNIGGLDDGFIEAVGEGGGDVFGAGHPADVALDANPDRAESDANAFRIGKNARPTAANFVPAEEELAAGLNAFDIVVVGPDSFHLGHVDRFESGVEVLVRGADALFGS